MSLFFLHPIYLFGLITAAIPLLIHLLNRRRLKRIRFPAVRFVLLSQRRISRAYRLRHWLLLALRTCAVFLLVLLLAHPIFQTGVGLFAGGGPLSLVIVLDNSLSMKWSREGEGFKQAKEAARLLISALKEGDRIAVVPTNTSDKSQIRLKGEREILLRELDAIQISAATANFAAALSKAYDLLKEPVAQREIWLMTDMTLTGWDQFSLSALGAHDPLIPLKIIKIEGRGEPLNGTVKEVRLHGQGVGVGVPLRLEASVVNFGNREIKDLLVQLHIDDQNREQKLLSLPPRAESAVGFLVNLNQAGDHYGQVTLKKEGLAGNPSLHFTLRAQNKLNVLVVDGDPQTSLVQSETFFITRALNPAGERDSSLFLPKVILPEGLGSTSFDSYQALILCNVPVIPDALLARLRDYVRRGGGVLFFLGDRVQMDDYNAKLFQSSPALLPAPIREKRLFAGPGAEKVATMDTAHPALQGFADETLKESLRSARIQGYFRIESAGGTTLLSLSNGDPLLVEKKVGPGRVALFTTAADRDWSDLPLKSAYLPLIQSLVTRLSGGNRGSMDPGITVGSRKVFSFPPAYVGKSLRVIKPDRKEKEIAFTPDRDKASASFQENDLAGIYRLSLTPDEAQMAPQMYPVNSPFLESRLQNVGDRELQEKLHPLRAEMISLDSLEKGGKRTDLSLALLLLLVVTLASEGWLAQRF